MTTQPNTTLFTVDTPCIGICSTVYGDSICRGCKRSSQEVIDWNRQNETSKNAIFDRLEMRQQQVMIDKVEIIDQALLESILIKYQIRYRTVSSPLSWAYHLLRVRPNHLERLEDTGIQIKSAYQHYSLRALFTLLDKELLDLSA
jgi:predicted Fe-S protein YdhL (DUF1289 family)